MILEAQRYFDLRWKLENHFNFGLTRMAAVEVIAEVCHMNFVLCSIKK